MCCSRTACQKTIKDFGYTIFNNGTVEGRNYCFRCGRNILDPRYSPKLEWRYFNPPLSFENFCKLRVDLAVVRVTHSNNLMRSILLRTSFLTRKELYRFFQSVLRNVTPEEFETLCELSPLELSPV
jgi:hypothetical protein